MNETKIKLSYIHGLREVVLDEISKNKNLYIVAENEDSIYLDLPLDLHDIKELRSVTRAYIVLHGEKYNPAYISKHKSIIGNITQKIMEGGSARFKTFKISCAGSDSFEVQSITEYMRDTFHVEEAEEADLKIHIIKPDDAWEVGIQITPRPLSVRDYKVRNMSGAMDPTIAYAINSMCELELSKSYLNIFSGSGTLLIEAGLRYPHLEQLVGFDNDKKHLSLSIQNIKEAHLIKKVHIKGADIFNKPDFGTFDVITSNLPFGMSISKGEDLEKLYQNFITYCEQSMNPGGKLAVYTSEYEIFEKCISESKFKIVKMKGLKFMTSVNAYLRPKIFICEFKNKH